ncbi:amino acid adenylation domain-containing protein [Streptomyces sp. NPDC051954]|uniref:amino acid adenylation domain-containing protein n=1 Tax=Streptomyces sp. NPDC051954 TaxID=3155524 RepID=UPI003442A544
MTISARPGGGTLVDILRDRADSTPHLTALEFLDDDGTERGIGYAALDRRVRAVAAALTERGLRGERVMLLYPPGEDYVTAFLGCLYAGAVAVPVYVPTGKRGLTAVLATGADAGAVLAMSNRMVMDAITAGFPELATIGTIQWLVTDEIPDSTAELWSGAGPRPDDLAFLQYTSGSTGTPKGVMVRHDNLVHNSRSISDALGVGPDSRGVSWLPPYHDMGLIGGILQPLYAGFPCTLISPLAFVRSPVRWLDAISRHRATVSAAPDFAYSECVRRISPERRAELDLSSWQHAMVGAEPVRPATLDAFADAFADSGFSRSAFHPCYGLAEATLFVTGGAPEHGRPKVLHADRRELELGQAASAGLDATAAASLTGCGRPQSEDLVVLVDAASGRECLPGETGEIWVSGPTVTGGYWGRPELTDEVFHARLDSRPGREFLRTGDLGFLWHGELFVTGRVKDLLVVRGRNHYPQDIEQSAELAHPMLQPTRGAVFSFDDGAQEQVVLVHEVVRGFDPEEAPAVLDAVREAVAAEHGLALHAAVLVRPGAIPRTTSGKIRRRACRERWLDGTLDVLATDGRDTADVTPGTVPGAGHPLHAAVAETVALELDVPVEELRTTVPLVSLSLDSFRAARLNGALRERFGVEISAADILDGVTLDDLFALVSAEAAAAPAGSPDTGAPTGSGSGEAAAPPSVTPATRPQQWIWLLDAIGGGDAYHVSGGIDLLGPVDPELLRLSLSDLVTRHPALHCGFSTADDGTLLRTELAPRPLSLPVVDVSAEGDAAHRRRRAREIAAEVAKGPFDLTAGPLLRATLVRMSADTWTLAVAVHHIAVDGWSLGLLLRELGLHYRERLAGHAPTARPLPAPVTARDESADAEAAAFWREQLAGAEAVSLPLDAPPPQSLSTRGATLPFALPAELVTRLKSYAGARRATLFMVLLSGMSAVLTRFTGQRDLVIGAPVAARNRPETLDRIGLFVNTLPLRVDASGEPAFGELLARVRASCLAAYRHQDFPYGEIVGLTGATRTDHRAPLVRVALALQNLPMAPWQAGDVRAEPFELPAPGAQFEFSLHLREEQDGSLTGHAVYAADLFTGDTVRQLLDALALALAGAPGQPGSAATDLPMLTDAGYDRVVRQFSGDGTPLADGLVHTDFERQAQLTPDAPAVVWGDRSLSYGQLEARANRLAHRLRSLGVGPDRPVAVYLPRSPELVVALLGVVKAGGAYLPLDPDHPQARLALQLDDVRPELLLTDAYLAEGGAAALTARSGGPRTVVVDDEGAAGFPDTRPPATARPDSLVYVIHTSGTTGTPKGVMNQHAGVANRMAWMQQDHPLRPGERVLHKTPVGFDVSGWEFFWPLGVGASIVLAKPGGHQDPAYLARTIAEQSVTTCHFVPSMLRVFLDEPAAAGAATTLRRVFCSGEALAPELAARFHALLPGVELHNLYGPTEAAIDVTAEHVRPGSTDRVRLPIGRPVPGVRLHVLDERGNLVPAGVPGELCIGGIQLARGYYGRPALTARTFVPDPFGNGGRLYRTGDRARWTPEGTLEYLGRLDHQVKIRGQRVEPAEAEVALAGHPAVGDAVVLCRHHDGEAYLAAYLVASGDLRSEPSELRAFLSERLPPAMIPSAYVWLDSLPTGANGKLDRAALPDPREQLAEARSTPPHDETERRIAEIWCEVLDLPEVSVTAEFFALGGHSLQASRIAQRIRSVFGVDLPVGTLLTRAGTVEQTAALVGEQLLLESDPAEVADLLAELAELSEAEVAALLEQED